MSPFYTLIIAFAVLSLAVGDKRQGHRASAPEARAEDQARERKIREITWDRGAWHPIDSPCATCRDGVAAPGSAEPGVASASPRPNRQANNNLIGNPPEKQPKQPPPAIKPTTLLFEVAPQVVQPVQIAPVINGNRSPPPPQQQQQFLQFQPHLQRPPQGQPQQPQFQQQPQFSLQPGLPVGVNPPFGRFVFPPDGRKPPSNKIVPPVHQQLPQQPAPGQQLFQNNNPPQRRPVGVNPSSTVHLLPKPTLPQQQPPPAANPDPRRPFPPQRPSADKVIVEVNNVPERPEPEVTIGKGSGKPRVQLIYIPASALKGRKDPLAGIKGPVTDKLLAELNIPGAKIVSVVKTEPENTPKGASAPAGVKQLSPFSAAGKLNLDFVKSFLPQGADLISVQGLNGELELEGNLASPKPTFFQPQRQQSPPSPHILQALSNTLEANLREGEKKAQELEADRNRPVSPRFRPPINFKPLNIKKPSPGVIEKVVLSNPEPESSDPTISNPLADDGLALVLNMRAFKVKQDLSLIIHNEEKKEKMGIEEVIRSLRAVRNFGDVPKNANKGEYPEVFIAPSTLNPPKGYVKVKLEIPKESERATSGSPAPANLPNAYVSSRNHLPPDGFVKINLPKEIRTGPLESFSESLKGDFESRNPLFKDSSEQKLEAGSQFVPSRPFAPNGLSEVPAPALSQKRPDGLPSSLQKFWIPPVVKKEETSNDLLETEKKESQLPTKPNLFPVATTLRPPSNIRNGFRFWPTTKSSGSFGQLFQNSIFGGSSTVTVPSTTQSPFPSSTTHRFFRPPPPFRLPSTAAPPVPRYSFSTTTPAPSTSRYSYTAASTTTASPSTRYSFSTTAGTSPTFQYSSFPPYAPSTTAAPFTTAGTTFLPPAPLSYDVPPPQLFPEAPEAPIPDDSLPEAFIGPSDIETPEGYVKIQLPVPGIQNTKPAQSNLDNGDSLPEFFIAPADQEPPEGYVRIALPVAGNNEKTNREEQTAETDSPAVNTTPYATTVVTTTQAPTSQFVPSSEVPVAPGRLFDRPVYQQNSVEDSNSQEQQGDRRFRPAFLRPRRPFQEAPKKTDEQDPTVNEAIEAQPATEASIVEATAKDNSNTLFPPYQEAVRRFRGKYISDSPAAAARVVTTTPNPNPNYGRRVVRPVTRRPFVAGGRRKVLRGRRPINRDSNDLVKTQVVEEKQNEAATTVEPVDPEVPAVSSGDLESSGSRFIYHHEGAPDTTVVRTPEKNDDAWWAAVNKPFVVDADTDAPEVEGEQNTGSFVVNALPAEPILETNAEDGSYTSYVPLPADGSDSEEAPREDEKKEAEEEAARIPSEDAQETDTPVEAPEETVAEEEGKKQAVTSETFTATVPNLKQLLVDQGIDPAYASEVAEEAEKSEAAVFSVPKVDRDSNYPWKYTTINRIAKSDEVPEERQAEVDPEDTAAEVEDLPDERTAEEEIDEDVEPKEEEAQDEDPEPSSADEQDPPAKPDLILEPPPRDAPEDVPNEEKAAGSPNDIKILGISTATEVSEQSVICFRGKCIQQNDGKK